MVARRFDASRQSGGMTGIITEVEGCYASATHPVVQIYALRDCLALDYVGYQYDVNVGRRFFKMATPFYEDAAASTRWTPYAQLAQFKTPGQFMGYMNDANALVQLDLAALNPHPQPPAQGRKPSLKKATTL